MKEEQVFRISEEGRPPLSDRISEDLFNSVHQAIGNASMCWDNTYNAGTYDAKMAADIAFKLCHLIADEIEAARDAACGYIETTTKRVAVIDESEEDSVIQHFDYIEGDVR